MTGIEEADPLHVGHLDGAHAFGAPEIQELGFDDFLAGGFLLLFDAHDDAGERAGLGVLRLLQDGFDFFAAGLVEDLAEGRIVGQVDGEAAQRLFDGRLAVVVDGGDVAAAEVLQDHALEQVVDVLDGEAEVDAGVALDFAFALEVADAAGEEHHLADRQRSGLCRGRLLVAGAGRVQPPTEKDRERGAAEQDGYQERATHERTPSEMRIGAEGLAISARQEATVAHQPGFWPPVGNRRRPGSRRVLRRKPQPFLNEARTWSLKGCGHSRNVALYGLPSLGLDTDPERHVCGENHGVKERRTWVSTDSQRQESLRESPLRRCPRSNISWASRRTWIRLPMIASGDVTGPSRPHQTPFWVSGRS